MKTQTVLSASTLPLALRAIPDPPKRLYCRGDGAVLANPAVAIVGSRRCTRQGGEIAFALAQELAAQGLNVVSGLAYGIDAAAHRGALAAEGDSSGKTIAVLGSGLDSIYPRLHEQLAQAIVAAGGAVVTEYEAGMVARKHHFPARNRIVSGLCLAVVVVEASAKSGSLITARMALEQGRDVMAVPSSVRSPLAAGCHRLIREGAALVETAEQVIETLGMAWTPAEAVAPTLADNPVLAQIDASVTSLDAIVAATGLSVEETLQRLTELELEGAIAPRPGGYVRSRPASALASA